MARPRSKSRKPCSCCHGLGRLTRRWQRLQQSSDVGASNVQRRQGLLEGDFYGLRDWRPVTAGDGFIGAPAPAGKRPWCANSNSSAARTWRLVLELWQPQNPSEADVANVELAVSFAASIVSDLCRRGGRMLWMAVAARSHPGTLVPHR